MLLLWNASAAPPPCQVSCSWAFSSPACSLPLPSCPPMELATVLPNASVRMCAAFSLPPLTQVETTLLVTPRAKLDAKAAAPAFWVEMRYMRYQSSNHSAEVGNSLDLENSLATVS